MITDILLNAFEAEGMVIENRDNVRNYLNKAILDDRLRFLSKDGQMIGFYAWDEKHDEKGTEIFVNNMLILKKYCGKYNLHKIATYFRERYKDLHKIYWQNRKLKRKREFLQPQGCINEIR